MDIAIVLNSSTANLSEYIPSGFSISTISSFRNIENKTMYAEVKIV